jgi:hypothetical protein
VDIKNAKNGAKTTKIRLKKVQGLFCRKIELPGAKLRESKG